MSQLQKILTHSEKKIIERGYTKREIKEAMSEALETPGQIALQTSKGDSNSNVPPLTMVTFIRHLASILRNHWSFINDPTANQLFTRPPIVAFKRNRNISDLITSSLVKTDI